MLLLPIAVVSLVGTIGWQFAGAQCSDVELTAVVVLRAPRSSTPIPVAFQVVAPNETTNPDEAQILANIDRVFEPHPESMYFQQFAVDATIGRFRLYRAPATDLGAVAIVDTRDGTVLFAGLMTWAGLGGVVVPALDDTIEVSAGHLAMEPAGMMTFPSLHWGSPEWPLPEEVTANAMDVLRQTDLVRSFAGCGSYEVIGYVFTPSVGLTSPELALQLMLIRGYAAPPWWQEVAVERTTWSQVRMLYR